MPTGIPVAGVFEIKKVDREAQTLRIHHRFLPTSVAGRVVGAGEQNQVFKEFREWSEKLDAFANWDELEGVVGGSKIPELWIEDHPGSMSWVLRKDVKGIQAGLGAGIFYRPDLDQFWIQRDPPGSSTMTYYGPFDGDPEALLVGEKSKNSAKIESIPMREVQVPKWPRIKIPTGGFAGYGRFMEREASVDWQHNGGQPGRELTPKDGVIKVREDRMLEFDVDSNNDTDLSSLKGAFETGGLQVLALPSQNKIDSRALPNIGAMSDLLILYLGGAKIRDQDLRHLSGLNQLVRLSLQSCPVTDDAVVHLLKLKSLQDLTLYKTGITEKWLSKIETGFAQVSHSLASRPSEAGGVCS